jgi:adenylate cyclase
MPEILSSTFKSQVSKVFWITIAWTFISIFYFFSVYASLIGLELDISDIDTWLYFQGSILTGILAGLLGGTGMVFFWEKWLRTLTYGWSLLNILWTYTIIYFLVGIPTGLFVNSGELGLPFYHSKVLTAVWSEHLTINGLQSYLFWLFIVIGTLVVLLVNDKYGPGVFKDFLLGKYFHPRREERIFMFLDLRSSTGIAEKLGEKKYFNFLKDVFNFSTPSILSNRGEIYQYVGDEVVVSWKTNQGIENANCIQCFFDIQTALKEKSSYFQTNYGIEPIFKAGLHYGYVMAGEIGVVKRDIAFSGDVLNTTARIQNKCNDLGVDILISNFLMDKLNLSLGTYDITKMATLKLRGKESASELFSIGRI